MNVCAPSYSNQHFDVRIGDDRRIPEPARSAFRRSPSGLIGFGSVVIYRNIPWLSRGDGACERLRASPCEVAYPNVRI